MTRDGYASTTKNTSQGNDHRATEPADPDVPEHGTRRDLCLAPRSVKSDRLPDPLVADDGRAVSVREAGETYLKTQRWNWESDQYTSMYERHRYQVYPRILEADRHFRDAFDDLTTVMLTRRLSPLDDADRWLTLWECNEMLHGGSVHRSIRNALDYQLAPLEYEWLAVTAPTRSAGTPHEHIYMWIDDPGNTITTDHIAPALDKHLKYCANAYAKHHQYRADGTDGAITVYWDPPLVDHVPDEFFSISEHSQTRAKTGTVLRNTQGAQYVASQLTHLILPDYYADDEENPPKAKAEGAALAWASPYNWFRASHNIPTL